jgi:hypothetical protein
MGRTLPGVPGILDESIKFLYTVDKYLQLVIFKMSFEKLLIQTLNREASQFEVPSNFRRDLEEALADLEQSASMQLSREMIEKLKRDVLGFFYPAGQPVF